MAKARRFAEGTTVEVGKSRSEVEGLLTKHGAFQIIIGTDTQKGSGFVHFSLQGRQYRMLLPPREVEGSRRRRDLPAAIEQVRREQWRSMLLLLKAKLEVVASGMVAMEQEFLAYIVLPNGSTVGAEMAPKIAEAYQTNKMPALLPAWQEE